MTRLGTVIVQVKTESAGLGAAVKRRLKGLPIGTQVIAIVPEQFQSGPYRPGSHYTVTRVAVIVQLPKRNTAKD